MQVNPSFATHTLNLFGVKASPKGRSETVSGDLSPPLNAMVRSADISALYGPPPLRATRAAPTPSLSHQVIARLKAFRDIELAAVRSDLHQKISGELGRKLGADEDIRSISSGERWSLSPELFDAAWTENVAKFFVDFTIGMALGRHKEIGLISPTDMYGGRYQKVGDDFVWDVETAKELVRDSVESTIGTMKAAKEMLADPAFAAAFASSREHDAFKAKASSILDLDDAAVEQIRGDLFAQEWARYEAGDLKFYVA